MQKILISTFFSINAFADIASGLESTRGFLLNAVFPSIAIIGIVYACFQLVFGDTDGLRKAGFAGIGVGLAFGSQALISLLRGWFA